MMAETGDALSERDHELLRRAIELAWQARRDGDKPFGTLLADGEGTILAEAVNTETTDDDISAHPELKLAVWAARNLTPAQAQATTMFTSTENCAMCSGAFAFAGLGRLVFALSGEQLREVRGATGLPSPGTSSRTVLGDANYPITVVGPALADEGRVVHEA